MYRLWLEDKLTMSEVDGPVWPATGRSIDDIADMVDTLTEWQDAGRRLHEHRGEDD